MRFVKMQALGNDFILFGSPSATSLPSTDLIKRLCDRHYGIGADCAVFIQKSKNADYFMHVYNPNGFEAEMCGNALRCSAEYVKQCGYFSKQTITVQTKSGTRSVKFENGLITTEIGRPRILKKGDLHLSGLSLPYTFVDIGNPHGVIFVPALTNEEFACLSPLIEHYTAFQNGTNVEFAIPISEDTLSMRVWERGIGETLSCTTGSCACAAVAFDEGICGKNVNIHQAGGVIKVNIRECGNHFVTADCETVFKGSYLT